jgi:pyruvate dehydrogenase E2 component (dihydrolipoamide acetyltransferase)
MATRVLMPKLSFIVTQGTILEWLKKPGDRVNKAEPLLVVESEKATVEVESPGTGILGPDLAPPGTTVPVTTTIGYILEPGEEPPKLELDLGEPFKTSTEAGTDRLDEETPLTGREKKAAEKRRVRASPVAKRLAREHSIDLSTIEGSGPQGRIVKEDVLARVEARTRREKRSPVRTISAARGMPTPSPASGPPAEQVELTSIQRITAERMALSFRTAPHFYLSVQVDMSQAVAMREALLPAVEAATGVRLSFSDILVYAVGRMLREHPPLNAAFEEEQLKRYQEVNVGLAVDTPRGLTVPVFHRADRISLDETTRRRAELVERARNNRLTPDDISGGTFTISNLGMFGVDVFSAIINPPQAAILAAGRIAKRPLVVDDALQVRPTMWLSLSVDHRAADGASASSFLQDLVRYLEDPYQMLI